MQESISIEILHNVVYNSGQKKLRFILYYRIVEYAETVGRTHLEVVLAHDGI